ncbi:hypothetical protein Taro_019893 [Colocasia esculenta]|uniref:Uncharacterized protein n=1 Tax=Colocasia esculenta TaxID=4460 RepID=A0A843V6W3_COLES|nr:hypothetical protein [Colocasia esculenta]
MAPRRCRDAQERRDHVATARHAAIPKARSNLEDREAVATAWQVASTPTTLPPDTTVLTDKTAVKPCQNTVTTARGDAARTRRSPLPRHEPPMLSWQAAPPRPCRGRGAYRDFDDGPRAQGGGRDF